MKKAFKILTHLPTRKLTLTTLAAAVLFSASATYAATTTVEPNVAQSAATAPAPAMKTDAPNRYVVQRGDTLWDLAGRYLNNPLQWRQIWAANQQVKNPNLIYPGDVLLMCIIQGETLIGIDNGEGCLGIEEAMSTPPTTVAATSPQRTAPARQSSSRITITPLDDSIPPIPLANIRQWLDRMLIVNPADYETTPYVIASETRNLITATGDKIYIKGVPLIVGQRYGVYRASDPYVNPRTQEVLGLEVTQVASGVATAVASNGVTSIQLLQSYGSEVREGDHVFVELGNNMLQPVFYPSTPHVDRGGMIVRIVDSLNNTAAGGVVSINLGTNNGAKAGDVFTILQRGALIRDIRDENAPVRLPNEETGHLMIFKAFDDISYAYILDSELPVKLSDRLLPATDL